MASMATMKEQAQDIDFLLMGGAMAAEHTA